jgi:glyoxylase-like metal-dependent hydrolase (beta-lactamase superfamily II)/8-oxo-dGTP pyrophosphatase MutT (NUDIX family)
MPRQNQLLHPPHVPAPTRAAATLLLLRDGADGIEVLLTRRSASARFAPGAYVFPGGAIDPEDGQCHALAARRAGQDDAQLMQAVAAIRESFEELGLLLARHADGRWADQQDIAALDRQGPFAAQCAARGLTLAADQVHWLVHWITDRDLPIRFDVPFMVARMPEGQQPVADGTEQFEPVWLRPQDALARHAAGQLHMIHPTIHTLDWLGRHASVDEVLALSASEQPLWTSCPRAGWLGGRKVAVMEHEPAFGELELTCPDGQLQHALDWQSDHVVGLLRNLQRLTAPNPGFMTGPGTNSYLVGDPASGHVAIDPGPDDPTHVERLWRAAGGDIRAIICTHSHPDHSPGAARLQALVEQAGRARPPILGLASGPHARHDSRFTPERELADGERIELRCADGTTHTLRVLHTPGHTANHLCLVLEEDGLLFSGDHVLNGSTTLVAPPDGNMNDYLDSLDRLQAACETEGLDFILPAHGHVLGNAAQAIARLKAHRLAREAKVAAAMQALPEGTPDDWVRLAYSDTPERLWPVAKLSLLAHVQRIESLGGFNV